MKMKKYIAPKCKTIKIYAKEAMLEGSIDLGLGEPTSAGNGRSKGGFIFDDED